MSGSSMACPHVTGAVAIIWQKDSSLTNKEIYNILLDNADRPPGGEPYPNNIYGWGFLNCYAALQTITIREQKDSTITQEYVLPTIISGPLHLPQNQEVTVFDISGREVDPPYLAPGVYFIENDKKIIQKIIIIK